MVVEECWRSVIALDDAPRCENELTLEAKKNIMKNAKTHSKSSLSSSRPPSYYAVKVEIISQCAVLFELIHSTVCIQQNQSSRSTRLSTESNSKGSTVKINLSEITKLAKCSDIFANLLFRIYKNRVHSWLDSSISFDTVMDIYDEGN